MRNIVKIGRSMKKVNIKKSISLIALMLIAAQIAMPTAYSANEFVKRTDVPTIEEYKVEVPTYEKSEIPESLINTEKNATQELENQKQARVFSYKTINSLIQTAKKTKTKTACAQISTSYTCSSTTDKDGLTTFTFKYKQNYNNADFKVITTVNSDGILESQKRYAYGEHKYDIFYDAETTKISKAIIYVDGLNEVEWSLDSEGEIFNTIYRLYEKGNLIAYIELGYDDILIEEIYYYGPGKISSHYMYEDGLLVSAQTFYENGQICENYMYTLLYSEFIEAYYSVLVNYKAYNEDGSYREIYIADESDGTSIKQMLFDELGRKIVTYNFHPHIEMLAKATSYHSNGKVSSIVTFNEEEVTLSSSQYSYAGKIQNSYTYYTSRTVRTEKLYDLNGKLGQYSAFFTNGKYKSITNYNAGKISTKSEYISNGYKSKYTKYHTNGKAKSITTYKSGKTTGAYTYDSKGRKIGSVTYKNGKKTYAYKYNSAGKLTTKYQYNSKEVLSKKWTYNSETKKMTSYTTYHANGKVNTVKKYYANGNLKSKTIYDKNGKVTFHKTY